MQINGRLLLINGWATKDQSSNSSSKRTII